MMLADAASALVRAGNGSELLRLAADIERGLYATDQLSRFAF